MRIEKLQEHIKNATATAKEFEKTIQQEGLTQEIIILISWYYYKNYTKRDVSWALARVCKDPIRQANMFFNGEI